MSCDVKKLEQIMIDRRYNKAQLARKAGMAKSTLCRKFKNGEAFTIEEANNIVDALELNKDEAIIIFLPSSLKNETLQAYNRTS